MGSWNETCGISRMSIKEGQQVKAFLIVKRAPQTGGTCYIDDIWTPIGLPIDVTYDDYGRFTPIKSNDVNCTKLLSYIQDNAIAMEQGKNKHHDIPVVPSELTWETINEAIHERRLILGDDSYNHIKMHVSWFAIHPIIYKSMMQSTKNGVYDEFKNIKNIFHNIDDKYQKYLDNCNDTLGDLELEAIKCLSNISIYDECSLIFGSGTKMNKFINSESTDDIIELAAEVVVLKKSMEMLRIPFAPVTGIGSQHCNYNIHITLANAIISQSKDYTYEDS